MSEVDAKKAVVVTVPTILVIVGGLYVISCLFVAVVGLPPSLELPPAVRVGGGAIVVAGLAMGGWTFRYRAPAAMIVSTYITFMKMFGRVPLTEESSREEPLVVEGPQKYTRNPLYFGVLAMTFGWGLAGGSTPVLVWAIVLYLWFRSVLIPFEERELRRLFGKAYSRYVEEVPVLVPLAVRRRPNRTG